jgi:hypothetical protein
MEQMIDRLIKRFVPEGVPVGAALRAWYRQSGYWYTTSFLVHAIGFVSLAIILTLVSGCPGIVRFASQPNETLTLESSNVEEAVDLDVPRFEVGQVLYEPQKLSSDTLLLGPQAPQKAIYIDDNETFIEPGGGKPSDLTGPKLGGLGGFSLPRPGPGGLGGVGVTSGTSDTPGAGGGLGEGLGGRGQGSRKALIGTIGGTGPSERAVAGGLNWLARHQAPAGNWSLQHTKHCKGGSCSGPGDIAHDAGATAMALLAFQGAGETHKGNGPYRSRIQKGISWLIQHQDKRTGDLSAGTSQPMYSHGLATIALCEAYAMTRDKSVGEAANKAVRFIERAQNEATGGWRYVPGQDGDTSVLGWQVMALKSGQMAGIGVSSMAFEGARRWLASVAEGKDRGLYKYQPYDQHGVTSSMTAVGMLCQQYIGIARNDASMLEGKQHLLANLPDANLNRDIYYWYYATLVMHNFMGPEWDRWNRQMRRTLIDTQCKGGCAEGSWDPSHPTPDRWDRAGRVYMTAFSTLTLEVYYRYLPLFKINQGAEAPQPPDKMSLVIGLPASPTPDKPAKQTP